MTSKNRTAAENELAETMDSAAWAQCATEHANGQAMAMHGPQETRLIGVRVRRGSTGRQGVIVAQHGRPNDPADPYACATIHFDGDPAPIVVHFSVLEPVKV